jgi:hypothetical protein
MYLFSIISRSSSASKMSRFFGPRYIGEDFLLGPNLVSFNRTVVPCEISKVNFRECVLMIFWQTWLHILMNKKQSAHCKHVPCNTLTHSTNEDLLNIKRKGDLYFLNETSACVSVVSDVQERVRDLGSPLRFMLRRSSLVECVSVLHGTCLQCADFFFIRHLFHSKNVCPLLFLTSR